jgi:hypothetical protein
VYGLILSAILLHGNKLSGILLSVVAPFVLPASRFIFKWLTFKESFTCAF